MTWAEANQRYLVAAVAAVGEHLDRHAREESPGPISEELRAEIDAAATELVAPPAIDRLAGAFGLSGFERDTLLLLAGVELNASFSQKCAAAMDDHCAHPTFALALGALPDAHWSALAPSGPLRFWKMLEIGPGDAMTTSRLRIDERILHHLTGIDSLDERLQTFVAPAPKAGSLPSSHRAIAERIAELWRRSGGDGIGAVVHLTGPDPSAMTHVAVAAAAKMGMELFRLYESDIPAAASERQLLVRLWERDAVLSGRVLLLHHGDRESDQHAARLADMLHTPVLLAGRESLELRDRNTVVLEVGRPTAAEQRALWSALLPEEARPPDDAIEHVVGQFDLGSDQIRGGAIDYVSRVVSSIATEPADELWEAARTQSRPRGETLAQRIDARATWEDLVLPDRQVATLRQIATQVRHRKLVYEEWGFGERESRGLGISALFSGRSGTGKTMAAEVLANELRLDLYRVDLSSVVSKYIGDTEKNLRKLFDAAESGGSILLFDEADALFGKRSEVKDSHDRYANIEVSYLLQRMEAYRGLAILTTNMRDALDPAFLRRIRFVIDFQFPGPELRERMWGTAFPAATPVSELQPRLLAKLSVAGGNIRNIARNGAFLAAAEASPVTMQQLLSSSRDELKKTGRTLSESEVRGWS